MENPNNKSQEKQGQDKINQSKKNKLIKKLISVIVLIILVIGGLYGYKYYQAYQKKMMEQKKAQEEALQKKLAEEKRLQELKKAKAEFNELVSQMEKYYEEGRYTKVEELAQEAKEIALKWNFSLKQVNKILFEIKEKIAYANLQRLEALTKNIYDYKLLRDGLERIPRYPLIKREWDVLWYMSFQNEYVVDLILAEKSAETGLKGENPETNYNLSKLYLSGAIKIRKEEGIEANKMKENKIEGLQRRLFFTGIQKNTQPVGLYK
ncbi:MAG: tetratricopeptide repeat protein [Candidatus Omnitrophica bacterium]|nr:tetratricopeptide repeat protein [Candidatus Omnitrophota bacterium]